MTMRAGRQIKKGAEITNSYVDPQVIPWQESFEDLISQDPFLVRQELLKLGKFFHCSCSRWPFYTFLVGPEVKYFSNQSRFMIFILWRQPVADCG